MIKRLAKCIREYKKPSILTSVFVSHEVVMEVVIPLIMAVLIDDGIDKGDMKTLGICGAALLAAAFISMLFGILAGKNAAVASCGLGKNLRHDMYRNVQEFSFANIDKFSPASIVTRLTTDVTNIQNAYQMIIRGAIRSPFMMIFSLTAAFMINAKLSLIFIACIPVLAAGLYVLMTHAHPIFERVFKIYDKLNRVVQENLRGIRGQELCARGARKGEVHRRIAVNLR